MTGSRGDIAPAMRVHTAGDLVDRALGQVVRDRAEATDALFLTELGALANKVAALVAEVGLLDPALGGQAAEFAGATADLRAALRRYLERRPVDEAGAAEVEGLLRDISLLGNDGD